MQKLQEKVKELTDKLEQGIKKLYESKKYQNYLKTMAKFHNYSYRNVALILMQKPDATNVAGYNAWKTKFKRQVKKGEKGIQIFAPAKYKTKVAAEKIDPLTQKPIKDSTGQIVKELIEIEKPYFRSVYVFDISQTEGEPLLELANELNGDVENYDIFFQSLQKVSPYPIVFEAMSGNKKGYCNYLQDKIAIKTGMDDKQNIKTAVHEISHALLHQPIITFPPIPEEKTKNAREVEAESVAFIVCQHYNIDTSDYSFGYIANWSRDKDLMELKNSLSTIQETAKNIISKIDENYQELLKEQTSKEEQILDCDDLNPTLENLKAKERADKEVKESYDCGKPISPHISKNSIHDRIESAKTKAEQLMEKHNETIIDTVKFDNEIDLDKEKEKEKELTAPEVDRAFTIQGNSDYYKMFYAGSGGQDKEAIEYQKNTGWNRIWGSESNGLNGDTWIVYRSVNDLPKRFQNFAKDQEKYGLNVTVNGQNVGNSKTMVERMTVAKETSKELFPANNTEKKITLERNEI